MVDEDTTCPICGTATPTIIRPVQDGGDVFQCDCPNCGNYHIEELLKQIIVTLISSRPNGGAILSHAVRRMAKAQYLPHLSLEVAERIVHGRRLPTPAEQADNVVLWYGENASTPGMQIHSEPGKQAATFGTSGEPNFRFIFESLEREGLLSVGYQKPGVMASLTFQGWQRYTELKKKTIDSNLAFMAMPFGNTLLDIVYSQYFKPAADRAGFLLRRLDEQPTAGLIDDRMRVEIRRSRFLVAELTNGNHGAYWEAGFAEGLGLPVIYTCEDSFFRENSTHFDTNHLHTVVWKESDLNRASRDLAATIRATLPDEAKMDDNDTEGEVG